MMTNMYITKKLKKIMLFKRMKQIVYIHKNADNFGNS